MQGVTAMGRTNQLGWLDPHIDALKRLNDETGLSCAQLAVQINVDFGTSYSRNAVIGKLARLGLVAKNRPGKSTVGKCHTPRERKPRVRIIRSNGNSTRQRVIESAESEPIMLRLAAVVPLNISLDELHGDVCHYPYGDVPPFAYCGHATLGAGPYCDLHHELCHKPALGRQGRESELSSAMTRRAMLPSFVTLVPADDWQVA
jgi:GcrA cell cycle regulator